MRNLHERVGDHDLLFVVTAFSIQVKTGGNLGEILARLSKLIRERFKLGRKVTALSSEGRFSAIALSIMPILLFGVVNLISPQYFGDVWNNPIFRGAMILSAVLLAIGNFIMRRMVKFKY